VVSHGDPLLKPSDKAKKALLPVAEKIKPAFPNLEQDISQALLDIDPTEVISQALWRGLSNATMATVGISFFGYYTSNNQMFYLGLLLWPVLFLFSFLTSVAMPKIAAKKRARKLEKDLPYALRHILIEVEAGIPLYHAFVSISEGYGEVSKEFKRIAKEINGGKAQVKALEDTVARSPSIRFRKALWQIINALKSGANVSSALESLVDSITRHQVMEVRKYGKELNPYTMMYMLLAVIIPSLGVTFLMILSSFTDFSVSNHIYYLILIGLVFFQAVFLNFVKSKRPEVAA